MAGSTFAEHQGYREFSHHIESGHELTEARSEDLRRFVAEAESAGFELATIPDRATDDQWQEAYDFLAARMREAPDFRGGGGAMPYSIFRAMAAEPWMAAVGRRDGELVAITFVMRHAVESWRLHTVCTGVHPDARGEGLSCALKAFHAEFCRGKGWAAISTRNMDQNAPILAVNRRLGFGAVAGHRGLGKALSRSTVRDLLAFHPGNP